jgi:serine/threonine-protein kinase RsbW
MNLTQSFPGKFEHLEDISQMVGQAAEKAGLDDSGVYAVQLAVDEACTNIIEHAYGGEGLGLIDVTTHVKPTCLIVQLRDFGRPFDPASIPVPQTNLPLEEIQPRGIGLYLIRKMMDEIKFEFTTDRGNILTMVKNK